MTQSELIKEVKDFKKVIEQFREEYENKRPEEFKDISKPEAVAYEHGKIVAYMHIIDVLENNEVEPEWNPIGTEEVDNEDDYNLTWTGDTPEEDSIVLITLTGGTIAMTSFSQEYGFDGFDPDEVIAWMPLPRPYKMEVVE